MLTDEQAHEMYTMVRELHAAMTRAGKPTLGDAVNATSRLHQDPNDPAIKFDLKAHRGPPMKGRPMSACSPAYLEKYARAMDECADKNESRGQDRYARWDREAAVKAREWAQRLGPKGQQSGANVDDLADSGAF